MAEVVLFHHVRGLTAGVVAFAEELRRAGHTVHTPDLFEGRTFGTLAEGLAHARSVGFETVLERGVRAAEELPAGVVYGGFSMGGMPAQKLAMTRAGAKGALLLHTAIPLSEFGGEWPVEVPLQIHTMEEDEWGDVDVARELEKAVPAAELFVYPGDKHLFTDSSTEDFDVAAAALVRERVLG
jgi:dienelactone hydrolase